MILLVTFDSYFRHPFVSRDVTLGKRIYACSRSPINTLHQGLTVTYDLTQHIYNRYLFGQFISVYYTDHTRSLQDVVSNSAVRSLIYAFLLIFGCLQIVNDLEYFHLSDLFEIKSDISLGLFIYDFMLASRSNHMPQSLTMWQYLPEKKYY